MSRDFSDEDREAQQEYEAAQEEAWYYATLRDFISVIIKFGEDKVKKDLGEIIAYYRRLQEP